MSNGTSQEAVGSEVSSAWVVTGLLTAATVAGLGDGRQRCDLACICRTICSISVVRKLRSQ
jgi:hypothetical protein